MTRVHALGIIVLAGILAGSGLAQKKNHDVMMRDIQATFSSLRMNLDGNNASAVAADAEKLEALFKETEDFWAPFKTKDALEAAATARGVSAAVAGAARQNDLAKAKAEYSKIGKSCTGCHASHREQMPDKSFRIKP
jgi:cytochrome c556